MNRILIILLLSIFSMSLFSQDITGDWMGKVTINTMKLDVAFHIEKMADNYALTMDIPLQGLSGVKAESATLIDSILTISFPDLKLEYKGNLSENGEIIGSFMQRGNPIPLNLKKGTIKLNRPQEPKPPFSYYSEEITFMNVADTLKLAGTLTLPKKDGKFPVVIIVSGSGPQNRDGEMMGHKPYFLIADQLTRNGIGVLRFDERGVGASEGDFNTVTIAVSSSDVKSAVDYLKTRKEIDASKIGLIGHSIGGIVAPKVASETENISFLVLLAAPGVNGDILMLSQKAAIEKTMGLNEMQIAQGQELVKGAYDIIKNSKLDNTSLKDSINSFYSNKYGKMFPENQRKMLVAQITSFEVASLIQSKPSEYLEKIDVPVLAMNGDKDLQVPADENLMVIKNSLTKGSNDSVKIMKLENLNHLFQECKTGAMSEYSEIEQTFSPTALDVITSWIQEQTK
ncbi:alpha/beta hydrolase family protein [Aquimarina rubra]|uniref:Alpha/beta hydrolase family protein n=1 Tax=Aquimarina rubra TaxID=1920033 RepID=A0ABW5LCF8_9FLAO